MQRRGVLDNMRIVSGLGWKCSRCVYASLVSASLLVSCSGASGHGTLAGKLLLAGGPASSVSTAPLHPYSGTVVAKGPGGSHIATAGADGHYSMHLPPGKYIVTGTSPQYVVRGNAPPCQAVGQVTVVRDQVREANVYCDRP